MRALGPDRMLVRSLIVGHALRAREARAEGRAGEARLSHLRNRGGRSQGLDRDRRVYRGLRARSELARDLIGCIAGV